MARWDENFDNILIVMPILALVVGLPAYLLDRRQHMKENRHNKEVEEVACVQQEKTDSIIDTDSTVMYNGEKCADTLTTRIECVKSVVNNHCLQNLQQK